MDIKRAEMMARDLIGFYQLDGWSLKWDKAVTRNGQCRYGRREIGLSRRIFELANEEKALNTIVHELAHAVLGFGYGHGPVWAMTARAMGCDGHACNTIVDPQMLAKRCYRCTSCGWKYFCNRRLKNVGTRYHKLCKEKGLSGTLAEENARGEI